MLGVKACVSIPELLKLWLRQSRRKADLAHRAGVLRSCKGSELVLMIVCGR